MLSSYSAFRRAVTKRRVHRGGDDINAAVYNVDRVRAVAALVLTGLLHRCTSANDGDDATAATLVSSLGPAAGPAAAFVGGRWERDGRSVPADRDTVLRGPAVPRNGHAQPAGPRGSDRGRLRGAQVRDAVDDAVLARPENVPVRGVRASVHGQRRARTAVPVAVHVGAQRLPVLDGRALRPAVARRPGVFQVSRRRPDVLQRWPRVARQ